MPKFIIERELPGVGKMPVMEHKAAAQKSCDVLRAMGPGIQWLESYVTDDKLYCVYFSANEEAVREHARLSGFPATRIARVRSIIDPTMAE